MERTDIVETPAAPAVPPAPPATPAPVLEIVFKGRRREHYANLHRLPLREGDYVIVQAERGEDLGRIHHSSEWVSQAIAPEGLKAVLRAARPEDLQRLDANRAREERAFIQCRDRIAQRDLEMKLVDCEFQLDGNRVTFYFTAEKRVDFRELVKDLASIFRTRIELRQIGVRDEAGRIGGVGTCGRELCCATWLREFEPITLKMAKDQGLSPSPSKISGACGRLKCCLRYELDFYKESAREFPKIGSRLTLEDAEWEVGRVDIFHRTLHLRDDTGKETTMLLTDVPKGTKITGPTRDRRKGCDKTRCAARGTAPGDGESVGESDDTRPDTGGPDSRGPHPGHRPHAPRGGHGPHHGPPQGGPRRGGPPQGGPRRGPRPGPER
ncbi:MAG TPA: stage 0 sporulation family protein [Candidatus Binatia bacterium]|nr:stage 0 sporulation family protein [Candidatus Binatia bacterium]